MYFGKKCIEKYDLQESYNEFKIKLKILFCESGPRTYHYFGLAPQNRTFWSRTLSQLFTEKTPQNIL